MRYRDMAKHYLFEAGVRAARNVDTSAGLEIGDDRKDLTPGQLRNFRKALVSELERQAATLEKTAVIVEGSFIVPTELQ